MRMLPSFADLLWQVVVEMVKNKLGEDEVQQNGWLLDGYPRRLALVLSWTHVALCCNTECTSILGVRAFVRSMTDLCPLLLQRRAGRGD